MVVKVIRRVLGIFFRGKERVRRVQIQENNDDREIFRKVFTQFLKKLIEVFYVEQLDWIERIVIIIFGLLCGLGVGYVTKHLVILR